MLTTFPCPLLCGGWEKFPTQLIHLRAYHPNKPAEELMKLIGGGVGVDKDPFVFYAVEGALVFL